MKPKFYMLVGIPGSGKSQIAEEYRQHYVCVHSSDAIRKELYGDETDQKHSTMPVTSTRSAERRS